MIALILLCRSMCMDAFSAIPSTTLKEVGFATVDYSAVSEYIQSHYTLPSYFGEDIIRNEKIYDGRRGVFLEHVGAIEPSSLETCGFDLCYSPTKLKDFSNMKQVRSQYLKELRCLIPKALSMDQDLIKDIVFWHPMLRGEELSMQPRSADSSSSAPVASMVHMDTDVGAYGVDGLLDLVEKNRVDDYPSTFDRQTIETALSEGNRFLLLNLWRPLKPVTSAPLGIMVADYGPSSCTSGSYFPLAYPRQDSSRWYIHSDMKPEECLIFKQYDRRKDKVSDLWHCALNISSYNSRSTNLRRSFDIKAMVILKEKVPTDMDRLGASVKPVLSLEQSGDFCESQCKRR